MANRRKTKEEFDLEISKKYNENLESIGFTTTKEGVRIRCKNCGEIIESKSVHDFKFCKCEAVAVDGGHDYLRRVGALEDWEDLSVCETIEDNNTTEET